MSCRLAQGFLFGRPLPAEEAGKLLAGSDGSGVLIEMHRRRCYDAPAS